jgi:hypothetical protein
MYIHRMRNRQQMFIEMDRMARRPFACVQLDLAREHAGVADKQVIHMRARAHAQYVQPLLFAVHHTSPSPIAIEPTSNYRAAVVTVAVRMPSGMCSLCV